MKWTEATECFPSLYLSRHNQSLYCTFIDIAELFPARGKRIKERWCSNRDKHGVTELSVALLAAVPKIGIFQISEEAFQACHCDEIMPHTVYIPVIQHSTWPSSFFKNIFIYSEVLDYSLYVDLRGFSDM